MDAEAAVDRATDQFECPVCERTCAANKARILYGATVCRRCHGSLINRRQLAWIIDVIVWWLFVGLLTGILEAAFSPMIDPNASESAVEVLLLTVYGYLIIPLFFMLKDGFSGHSPGKWLCGVRVVDWRTREPIGWLQSFKRNLILFIPFAAIIVALHLWRGQRPGDKFAGTCVIVKKYAHRLPYDPRGILCTNCGYDLTGNVSGRCPECGKDIPRTTDAARTTPPGIPSSHTA